MPRILATANPEVHEAIAQLFASKSPVLVEVRFPRMAAASDWFLVEEEGDLEPIWERLAPGAELHLQSVWDLRPAPEAVLLTKK